MRLLRLHLLRLHLLGLHLLGLRLLAECRAYDSKRDLMLCSAEPTLLQHAKSLLRSRIRFELVELGICFLLLRHARHGLLRSLRLRLLVLSKGGTRACVRNLRTILLLLLLWPRQ